MKRMDRRIRLSQSSRPLAGTRSEAAGFVQSVEIVQTVAKPTKFMQRPRSASGRECESDAEARERGKCDGQRGGADQEAPPAVLVVYPGKAPIGYQSLDWFSLNGRGPNRTARPGSFAVFANQINPGTQHPFRSRAQSLLIR
jgi:hypothetical protein